MSTEANVVHLSPTPLVGAPGKISAALNAHTSFKSTCFVVNDYPKGLGKLFTENCVILDNNPYAEEILDANLLEADIVHVHNDLPPHLVVKILSRCPDRCRYVYHLHSPYREGPLFFPRHRDLGIPFSSCLSIPHFPHLAEPDFTLVPNLVLRSPSLRPLQDGERPRLLFSPSHPRRGQRWGDKVSPVLEEVLKAISSLRLADVRQCTGLPPGELFELRRLTHISIDEIVTGAFHQVSMEGWACGNVVVSAVDRSQTATLQALLGTTDEPPFFRVTEDTAREDIAYLVQDRPLIAKLQQNSFDFFQSHLRPERLVTHFSSLYEAIAR